MDQQALSLRLFANSAKEWARTASAQRWYNRAAWIFSYSSHISYFEEIFGVERNDPRLPFLAMAIWAMPFYISYNMIAKIL